MDLAFGALRGAGHTAPPKGMGGQTLDAILAAVRDAGELSAAAAAEAVGVSRATTRRYLEYLADRGPAARRPRYGTVGRPEVGYRLSTPGR